MKFSAEKSERVAKLDALYFPPPENTPIFDFKDKEIWRTLQVFSLCDANDELIGYVAWAHPWIVEGNYNPYLIRIGVVPEQRRLGFGCLLLNHFVTEVRKHFQRVKVIGDRAIFGDVQSGNTASRRLFKRAGWVEVSEYDGAFDAQTAVRVMYRVL